MFKNNYFVLRYFTICIVFVSNTAVSFAQKAAKMDAIYSGVPWFDQNGNIVSAHGANIIKELDTFYLFGESHTDTSNAFAGFNCYSSKDLYNWKFESVALPAQESGKLGPNRVGERVKVMKCPKTGEFIMYMHADSLTYKDQFVGYAVSKEINGPYVFKGPLLFQGKSIKKWDMGTFQDDDGSGYVLVHGGEIYKLSDDFTSVTEKLNENITSGFESPTLFRKDDIYYFIGSHLTSWEKNDNYYYTSISLKGPWISQGLVAPENTLTWNSQSTFVLPIQGLKETTYMFMGDRWSFPKQASSATYVWQPLSIAGTSVSMPKFQEAWRINTSTGVVTIVENKDIIIKNTNEEIQYLGKWIHTDNGNMLLESKSDDKNASFSIKFKGQQIGLTSFVGPENGYAKVVLTDKKGNTMYTAIIDMYSKFSDLVQVFKSPILKKNNYELIVSVTGERPNWSDKKKANYGSTGNTISLHQITIKK
ncbi:family 43 glycosylhydrolase [Flavobacterium sp. MR2016-29]|uniref:family 43 glycosylhydrolase n=1 Tax=Flavobacterium sp. MR2016-29 TaxID=2783795 RepID=UPI00188B4EFC|nr:family 43 glycosylhydrolase [Flavobacterium sp. MR2016-29]MBF4494791.1 family 43 glycosylhydrolase [Flavobacterium sp. MR2016-29]